MKIPLNLKKVLIITSSGGGGLKQVAKAVHQEVLEKNQEAEIKTVDMLLEIMTGFKWASNFYNWTQRSGNVLLQVIFVKMQSMADIVFWPQLFFGTLRLLLKYNFDIVYDTQVVGISAIIKAVRLYNFIRKKNASVHRVVVDMPTKKCTHFFANVKRLSKKDRSYLSLITTDPLLEIGETEDQFWKKNCGFLKNEVIYDDFPIRKSFKKYFNKAKCSTDFEISISAKSEFERSFIKKTLLLSHVNFNEKNRDFYFNITPIDKLAVVLLGSQPANKSTYNYVKYFTEIAKKTQNNENLYICVFCHEYNEEENTLFHKIYDFIKEYSNFPSNMKIIPMSFQTEDVISALFYRCDVAITRSGGSTAMELMSISHGEKWIHSEFKKKVTKNVTYKKLLKGIPFWEAGSAEYVKKKCNGKIVTPELISILWEETNLGNNRL